MNDPRKGWRAYALLFSAFLIYSWITVFSKLASMQELLSLAFFAYLGLEVFTLGIYALVWQQALKRFSLIAAMSSKGAVVVFSLIWSVILFQEKISFQESIGAVVIFAGIWLVAQDG